MQTPVINDEANFLCGIAASMHCHAQATPCHRPLTKALLVHTLPEASGLLGWHEPDSFTMALLKLTWTRWAKMCAQFTLVPGILHEQNAVTGGLNSVTCGSQTQD